MPGTEKAPWPADEDTDTDTIDSETGDETRAAGADAAEPDPVPRSASQAFQADEWPGPVELGVSTALAGVAGIRALGIKAKEMAEYIAAAAREKVVSTRELIRRVDSRRVRFQQLLREIELAKEALPPPEDPVWAVPHVASALLREFMSKSINTLDVDENREYDPSAKTPLDTWQHAAIIPLLRRREELIIAPAGSGKSLVCAHIMQHFLSAHVRGDPGHADRIVLAVHNQAAKFNQFVEITRSAAFQDGLRAVMSASAFALMVADIGNEANRHPYISLEWSRKPINIVTFVQLGNLLVRGGADMRASVRGMAGHLIILDEIHQLANPEDARSWAQSVHSLNRALDLRAELPYDERFVLVGMTATPPVDSLPAMEKLLGWFSPPGLKAPFRAAELEGESGPGKWPPVPPPTPETLRLCDMLGTPIDGRPVPLTRFAGVSIYAYSAARNRTRYASWNSPSPLVLLVPTNYEATVQAKNKGKDPGWRINMLTHWTRAGKLTAAYAAAVLPLLRADVKKTLVMLDGNTACRVFTDVLATQAPGEFELIRLSTKDKDKAAVVESAKHAFDAGGPNAILVADRRTYGTGHSFWSGDEEKRKHRGARRILYTPGKTAADLTQVEGRANRRLTHVGYDRELRNIDRIILVAIGEKPAQAVLSAAEAMAGSASGAPPVASGVLLSENQAGDALGAIAGVPGPVSIHDPRILQAAQEPRTATCEVAKLQLNIIGRWRSTSVEDAMFYSSFGVNLLWSWRPLSLEDAPRPVLYSESHIFAEGVWKQVVERWWTVRKAYRDSAMAAVRGTPVS